MLSSDTCSVGMDYTEEAQLAARPSSSVHKPDEMFLLPHEEAVHKTSVDSAAMCSDGGGSFEELDHLVHIDTDMSSLLHVMDCHLVQNSPHGVAASDDCSWVSTVEQTGGEPAAAAAAASDDGSHQADDVSDDKAAFHEYDPIYVPRNDAAAMARRVDNETSYVRTLQSRPRNSSPYEEVRFEGRRPLFVTDRVPNDQQPFVPPRTSSVADSRLQNAGTDGSAVISEGQADETDLHGNCHS